MEQKFDTIINNFDRSAQNWLSFLDNEYVSSALIIFLIVYATLAAPKLPDYILKLFDYTIVKLVLFFLIAYIAQKNASVAIVAAIGLLVTIIALNKLKLNETVGRIMGSNSEPMSSVSYGIYDQSFDSDTMTADVSPCDSVTAACPIDKPTCEKKVRFRDNFYPQYVNLNPDVYESKKTTETVSGFDPSDKYSTL